MRPPLPAVRVGGSDAQATYSPMADFFGGAGFMVGGLTTSIFREGDFDGDAGAPDRVLRVTPHMLSPYAARMCAMCGCAVRGANIVHACMVARAHGWERAQRHISLAYAPQHGTRKYYYYCTVHTGTVALTSSANACLREADSGMARISVLLNTTNVGDRYIRLSRRPEISRSRAKVQLHCPVLPDITHLLNSDYT